MEFTRCTPTVALVLAAIPLQEAVPVTANWPGFRGPSARGLAHGPMPPAAFDLETAENLLWQATVPGLAHSSPVVWGNRLFVTSAVRLEGESELSSLYGSDGYGAGDPVPAEGPHAFRLYCFDKRTGELHWERTARSSTPVLERHPKATHANSTPAVDGSRIVAFFGSEGLYCYDHLGELLWSRDLGPLNAGAPGYKGRMPWGFGSSPILHMERVYVQCDFEGESFLAALSIEDGSDIWRVRRREDSTWCTPTVHVSENRSQVIANGYRHIGGYDLDSGVQLWKLVGGGDVPVPTPVVSHGLIYLTSAHGPHHPLRAVPVDAEGDLGEEDLAWNQERRGVYMQTPLVLGDLVYACSDGGVLGCYDATTGEEIYRERLGSGQTGYTSSAVACGERIWWIGEDGEVTCVRAGRTFEVIARSPLGENCLATPAISEGVLYFRARHHIFAIGDE